MIPASSRADHSRCAVVANPNYTLESWSGFLLLLLSSRFRLFSCAAQEPAMAHALRRSCPDESIVVSAGGLLHPTASFYLPYWHTWPRVLLPSRCLPHVLASSGSCTGSPSRMRVAELSETSWSSRGLAFAPHRAAAARAPAVTNGR